jgi:FAD/FMN-containing dehydrogenase
MATTKTFYSEKDLIEHIKTHKPSFYFSSKTSTVIPYEKIEKFLNLKDGEEYFLCDLSKIPMEIELLENKHMRLRGACTWQEAREFLNTKGRTIMTSPTEELALVLAGAATSCTGERCFGYGNLRSQITSIKYLNHDGEEITLSADKDIDDFKFKIDYQTEFEAYKEFKNAPYPRFEKETDLMIGTEGQLGVITEIELNTAPLFPVNYFFLVIPKWEENYEPHLEIYEKVQSFRDDIISCELIDSNAFSYLKEEDRLSPDKDIIFLEIKSSSFEKVFEEFLSNLTLIKEEGMFEISKEKFHKVRASVPRAIFEVNSQMGVVKMGTDVQVIGKDKFQKLLDYYRECNKSGIKYNLFGHFGDAHLHYNFMPLPENVDVCQKYLETLYDKVVEWKGSPFAEHGIGIIKQKYIQKFWKNLHHEAFLSLKQKHDPHNQFFPQGYMNL